MYCIGIDGGGSKTLAYLADMKGSIIRSKTFGPSNYQIIGEKALRSVLFEILEYFNKGVNLTENNLKFISAGIAGLDRKKDRDKIQSIFNSLNLNTSIILNNDSYTSLAGALENEDGVILSSGTGSIALGKKGSSYKRVGGWTHVLGDEGSGYSIGLNALKSVMKVYDGRLNASPLYYEIMNYINVDEPRETITYAYKNLHNTKKISSITPLVYKFFKKNDPLGVYLINYAVKDLVQLVTPLVNEFYSDDKGLLFTYSGSIISELEYIKFRIIKKLQEKYPKIIPVDPIYNSGVGALIIGWDRFDVNYKKNLSNSDKA